MFLRILFVVSFCQVNGMDATRVGSRKVAEWIQTANLVSSNSVLPSDSSSSLENEAEWTFLYLLILPLNSSSFASSASNSSSTSALRPIIDLQSIPPVMLTTDSSAPSGASFHLRFRCCLVVYLFIHLSWLLFECLCIINLMAEMSGVLSS